MVTLFLLEQLKAENCIFCNEFARYVHNDFEVNKTWTTQKSPAFLDGFWDIFAIDSYGGSLLIQI